MSLFAGSVDEFRMMLADLGVSVTVGLVTTNGLKDYDDQVIEGEAGFPSGSGAGTQKRGGLIGRQIVLTVLSDDFPPGALAIDTPITADGEDYVIRLPLAHSHMGLNLTTLYLGKA